MTGVVILRIRRYTVAEQRAAEICPKTGKVWEVGTLCGSDGGPEALAICWSQDVAERIARILASEDNS
jgi:hypothetical protein